MNALRLILALAVTTALAAPAAAWAQGTDNCENVGNGIVACGRAEAAPCLVTGSGAATAAVQWTLVYHGSDTGSYSHTFFGPAYSGAVAGPCTTGTCVTGYLYADGVLIYRTMTIC